NLIVPMNVLMGDTNGDALVNAGDALQTRNRAGQVITATNFRSDVNADGFVNSGDTFIVRARSGTFLPWRCQLRWVGDRGPLLPTPFHSAFLLITSRCEAKVTSAALP